MTLRDTLRIARWEIGRSVGTIDRRVLVLLVLAITGAGLLVPTVIGSGGGGTLDDGLYRVGIDTEHAYAPAVTAHPALRPVGPGAQAEVIISEEGVIAADTQRGQAALSELQTAVQRYNRAQLAAEEDTVAAFPVRVEIQYVSTDQSLSLGTDGSPSSETTDETASSSSDAPGDTSETADAPTTEPESGTTAPTESSEDGSIIDSIPLFGSQDQQTDNIQTPRDISPPFPFEALLLAFLFVLPMNFVIQAYGSSIIRERLNRRGELLLVSPVTRIDIVAGKTLPYLVVSVLVMILLAVAVGGGSLSVAAVLPIVLAFLATTFLGAMLARSYKELTFVTVTISVVLTGYVFIPAIFTDITPVALISPLTLVVFDLQDQAVSLLEYGFSTGPLYISSAVLFGLGVGIYREEDMFTQRPVHRKLLDALAAHIAGYRDIAVLTALLLPFVFLAQLLVIATLFLLPLSVSLPLLLVTISVVEELAKSLHVFAAYTHDRFDRSVPTALAVGAASGLGFFLAEKVTHITQLVGLDQLALGRLAFATGLDVSVPIAVLLLILPLGLHTATAALSALGARIDRRHYLYGLGGAIFVHTVYNAVVIALVG